MREQLFVAERRREAAAAEAAAGTMGARRGAARAAAMSEQPQEIRAMAYLSDQGAVWGEVARTHQVMGVRSATSALSDTYEAGKDRLDSILQNLALKPATTGGDGTRVDQAVGVVVFVGGRFVCLDLLQPAKRFERLYPKLLRGYALEALLHTTRTPDDFDPEAVALGLFAELLEARCADQAAADLGTDLRLETAGVSGSGLVWQDELIQLSLFPKVVA